MTNEIKALETNQASPHFALTPRKVAIGCKRVYKANKRLMARLKDTKASMLLKALHNKRAYII